MAVKVGINGFGRIGRQVLKALLERYPDEIDVVAIHDIVDPKDMAHLFAYDSNYGRFPGEVYVNGDELIVEWEDTEGGEYEKHIKLIGGRVGPEELPWAEHGVQVVLECTGIFRTKAQAEGHIKAGAKKVIISAPASGPDPVRTIVLGVNEGDYDPDTDHVISNASCTTNCLAPVVKVLDDTFGVVQGLMTTVHSYTNDQQVLDLYHKDPRRARAAAVNLIPTTTGAAAAVGLVLPHLKGKLNGMSLRVPTPTVSAVDLVANTVKPVTVESVNAAFQAAAESDEMFGILGYSEEPLVSIDYKGDDRSSIVDALTTMVTGDNMVKVLAWYDNEWGYSCRCADLIYFMGYDNEGNEIL
ncbi:MAG: type I glyceraldehyde-3-phosphate dehydrogenase [Anaerolineae bacterium]|nr:type I glyceraldehyde-3-phosphate dehydrogenase [Anaerolineae bacterium]